MNLPDSKALKKLADACRKAGIKHFKNADLEFTLSDEGPVSNYKKRTASAPLSEAAQVFKQETLTDEQILFWSLPDSEERAS